MKVGSWQIRIPDYSLNDRIDAGETEYTQTGI